MCWGGGGDRHVEERAYLIQIVSSTHRNRTLQQLRLDDNGLGYEGVHALQKALARNTRLLDLPYSQTDAAKAFAYVFFVRCLLSWVMVHGALI